MKARGDDGVELDAEFEVERTEAGFDLILKSRGGSGENRRNGEYAQALRLLLRRMASHGLVMESARNASTQLRATPEQRLLLLRRHAYPVALAEITSIDDLQGDLGHALATFGYPPGKPGGNPTKRLRMSVTGRDLQGMSEAAFGDMLTSAPAPGVREVPSPAVEAPPLWTEPPTSDPEALATSVRKLEGKLKGRRAPTTPPPGSPGGRQVVGSTVRYVRDPNVIAWVLTESEGRCEACEQPAPFSRDDGRPFLEVHHIRPLAEGGPDTVDNAVATCPNCHRRLHYGSDRSDLRGAVIAKVGRLKDHGGAGSVEPPVPGEPA